MQGLLGLMLIPGLAWVLGERRAVRSRPVVAGLLLQAVLAVVLIRLPGSGIVLHWLDRAAGAFQGATEQGSALVFGYLGGGELPFAAGGQGSPYILAFRGLPLVLTISALAAVLYHWGVLQRVMGGLAWVLRRTLGIGGPLALGAAVHVFVGMIEAPLLIRPYLARMQRGELFALMSCGMAGIAGTVMVIYAGLLGGVVATPLAQLLTASVISTPAALALAALMVPFEAERSQAGALSVEHRAINTMDALVRGGMDGVAPLVGIVVLLIVAVATVSLINQALGLLGDVAGVPVTLQWLAAWPFRPLLWAMGVPWREVAPAALLMGSKTVLNEFVAFIALGQTPAGVFDARTRLILTYALCGFANFGSLGIMIGGLGAMVPAERRAEVVSLGLRSLVSGTLATCMSGAWVGLLAP